MNTSLAAFDRRPLVPDDIRPTNVIPRACWVAISAEARMANARDMVEQLYPRDVVTQSLITKAAISGASTQVPGWAQDIAGRVISQFLMSLAPQSAISALMPRGVVLSLLGLGSSMAVPVPAGPPSSSTPFVAEGQPIPVRIYSLTSCVLQPKKMGTIVPFTRELARYANAQAVFETVLRTEAGVALDRAYLSDAAATTAVHQGLLNGLTPLTGSAVMLDDLAKLAEAVAPPSGSVVFLMAPGRAAAAKVRLVPETAEVLASLAVAADQVVCIEPAVLVHGSSGDPDIVAADAGVLHMEDATPLHIATGPQGSAVVASPTQSMYQQATMAVRLLLDVCFGTRRAAVATMSGCTW